MNSDDQAESGGGVAVRRLVGASGQLRCPKCKALRLNVHASDLARSNGEVTCSNCGLGRRVQTFPAAQPRTVPSEKRGRGKSVICAAVPPGGSPETSTVTRRSNI